MARESFPRGCLLNASVVFSYSQQGCFPSRCTAYIAGSNVLVESYETMPGSVWWEECSPRGKSRQHLCFQLLHKAASERGMSNNAREKPTGLTSLVAPQEYLCLAGTEYSNGCFLSLTNQTSPFPTWGTAECLQFFSSRLLQWVTIPCCNASELLTSQYTLFRLGLVKLKKITLDVFLYWRMNKMDQLCITGNEMNYF